MDLRLLCEHVSLTPIPPLYCVYFCLQSTSHLLLLWTLESTLRRRLPG